MEIRDIEYRKLTSRVVIKVKSITIIVNLKRFQEFSFFYISFRMLICPKKHQWKLKK